MIKKTSMGAFEAKTHFGQLIERVRHGEEISITRRGKIVAKIVPAHDASAAQCAAIRLRSLAQDMRLGAFHWAEWKEYRDQGRA